MVILEPNERLKSLANISNTVEVDANVPPRRYYRSGLEMVRMANVYMDEGSLENAYVLYMKFMTLFIEKIRKHPEYASVPDDVKSTNSIKLREVLPKAEKLKAHLLKKYTVEYNKYLEEQKRKDQELLNRKLAEMKLREKREREALDNRFIDVPPPDKRWTTVIPAPTIEGVTYPDEDDVKTPQSGPILIKPDSPKKPAEDTTIKPVPVIPKPDKLDIPSPSLPTVDRSLKPSSLLSPSVQSKIGMRDVIVPSKLMSKFLTLAQKNTSNSIETCGVLAGKLERDRLIITHVIVSKQEGTSDTCVTKNEEEIFDYQDQHSLITLGWIHTHPTQTAFLSSIDVHTQCSYQIMMPEAIAIVCAPKHKQTGFYVLTLYGLELISQCRQTGFHPHPSDPQLFINAEHTRVDDTSFVEIVDLR